MDELFFVIPIVFVTVVMPIWLVLHYVAKMKANKSISHADEETLADMWQLTEKMENRIESLETILDEEVPGWRRRL